jgi:hypothetical protein
MKSLIAPLTGLGFMAAAIGTAMAAAPAYCALYAREYANQFAQAAGEPPGTEQRIQDEAYYRCLNLDQEPDMPASSAYYGTSVDTAGQGGPLEPAPGTAPPTGGNGAAVNAAPAGGDATAVNTSPSKPADKTADNRPMKHSYTSGEQPWTPAWQAWCRDHYPHSFNEKDGTIVPFGTSKRQLCK